MNSFSLRLFTVFFICSSSLLFSEPSHGPANNQGRPVDKKSQSSPSGYFKGRWADGKFEYLDDNNHWNSPQAAYRTTKDGTFLDLNGNTVEYSKGDILFKASDDGWYKARKETPLVGEQEEKKDLSVPNPDDIELSETERLVIKYTNEERMKRGLPPLKVAPNLLNLSRQKSANMAKSQNLSHSISPRPQGGENIAWNQANAKEVVRTWMNSDGHRANILNRRWTRIGVGVARGNGPYWTQMFQ